MLRQTLIILTIGLFISCADSKISRPDTVTFDNDPRQKDVSFKPSTGQIEKAEERLLEYLNAKTAENQTIYITNLDEKVPLQDQLK